MLPTCIICKIIKKRCIHPFGIHRISGSGRMTYKIKYEHMPAELSLSYKKAVIQ